MQQRIDRPDLVQHGPAKEALTADREKAQRRALDMLEGGVEEDSPLQETPGSRALFGATLLNPRADSKGRVVEMGQAGVDEVFAHRHVVVEEGDVRAGGDLQSLIQSENVGIEGQLHQR